MTQNGSTPLRCVIWGTYDLGKPRVRIMLQALAEAGVHVEQIHADVWSGIEDKSRVRGISQRFRIFVRLLMAYPGLVYRYLRASPHDAVIVAYLGQFDLLILWLFAKIRRVPIIWDAFISLHDTISGDRALIRENGIVARLLYALEWLDCRAASSVVLDTAAHSELFRSRFKVPEERLFSAFVGCESEFFQTGKETSVGRAALSEGPPEVLFYGQFIPLHGIDTIVDAALTMRGRRYSWHLVGTGQEAHRINARLRCEDAPHIRRTEWIAYGELVPELMRADICLGIFGTSEKAARVIPNKVFQILAAGRPLVTRESPAMRELMSETSSGIALIRAGDPDALLDGLEALAAGDGADLTGRLHDKARARFGLPQLAQRWREIIDATIEKHGQRRQ